MKKILFVFALTLPSLAGAEDKGQFYIAAGRFSPAHNAQLDNPSGQYGFSIGGGGRFTPKISWNVDLLWAEQRVDTPKGFGTPGFLVSQSGRAGLETWGLGGVVKATLPLGPFDFYAGGGPGFYRSTLTVHRQRVGFFTLTDESIKRRDQGLGMQWLAGVDLKLGERWALGFEWRRLDFKAQFGAEVPGEVNTGGNFGFLHSRWVF